LGPNVQKLLIDLENNLGSVLRKADAKKTTSDTSAADLSGFIRMLFFLNHRKTP